MSSSDRLSMAPTRIQVFFVLLPGSLVLDWGGPAEAFRIANHTLAAEGKPPRFDLRFIGPQASPQSSVGVALTGIEPLPARLPPGAWLVLVGMPGTQFDPKQAGAPETLRWLRTFTPGEDGLKIVSICVGALMAAHAGLLDGRRATTHHQHLDELRRVAPRCEVVANRVFTIDGCIASSAGVTTGVDLALHLIAQECGAPVASRVAQVLVVALRRGPQDPELSPFLAHRNHMHPAVHRVQDAVCAKPQAAWNLARMAEIGCTSPRHLTRLFVEHAGTSPLLYLRGIRLALAHAALESGQGVTRAAELAGFSSDTQLRRAWNRLGLAGRPSDAGAMQGDHG